MEKRIIAGIIDYIFLIVAVWLISYLWTRYYVMNLLVALCAATGIALCIIMLINIRRQKNRILRKKQRCADNIMNEFLYGGKDFSIDFLFSALKKRFETDSTEEPAFSEEFKAQNAPITTENRATLEKTVVQDRERGLILVDRTAVMPMIKARPLCLDDIIECYISAKKAGAKRIIILSKSGCDREASRLGKFADMVIEVFDKMKSYDFLGWLGAFPKKTIIFSGNKVTIKSILRGALSRNKFKHYLSISLVLMISSYFVMYSIYYIIIASLALTLALLTLLAPLTRSKTQK